MGVGEVLEKARMGRCAQGVHESAQGRQIWELWEKDVEVMDCRGVLRTSIRVNGLFWCVCAACKKRKRVLFSLWSSCYRIPK